MAWTEADLTTLETAIAAGEQTVQYRDHRVTYRSLAEMLQLRDLMRKTLGLNGADYPRRTTVATRKDLG